MKRREIIRFLTNFFLLEALGRVVVDLACWVLRWFGMPQLYFFVHTTHHFYRYLFTAILLVAVASSVIRIWRKGRC